MFGIFALAVSLAANAAAAQPTAAAPQPDEITVEGTRNPDKQIREFVSALTDAPIGGQLSRFDWAVCPAAVGLGDAQNAAIAERMRKVAAAAGIQRAPAGCRPNVLVLVTRNKRDLIEQLHKRHPAYFEGLSPSAVRRLARHTGPAAAWQVEGLLNRDGLGVPRDAVTGTYVNEVTDMPSRISPTTRPHFAASVVVIDIGALSGLSVTQLADYAAMRTFARTDPSRLEKSAAPTILTVLDAPMGSLVPETMTEWDLGFLKALYDSDQNRFAASQRKEISDQLRDDLRSTREGED